MLTRSDEVVVVTPNSKWNWIPSNIWVGVGKMKPDQVTFDLAPIYKRKGIEYHQALATAIHPEGDGTRVRPFVDITYTDPARAGKQGMLEYDYLINATGPKLNFGATPGLGPDGFSRSVCTSGHAVSASAALQASIEQMKHGHRQVIIVGMGTGPAPAKGRRSSTRSMSSMRSARPASGTWPTSSISPTSTSSGTSASAV